MSNFTISLLNVVRSLNQNDRTIPISTQIDNALPLIFNFPFPIFLEEHRKVLERKIVMKYLNREIGYETFPLWQLHMEETLNRIMPFYNQLYALQSHYENDIFEAMRDTFMETEHYNNTKKTGTDNVNRTGTDNYSRLNTGSYENSRTDTVTGSVNEQGQTTYGKKTETCNEGTDTDETVSETYHSDFPQGNLNSKVDYSTSSDTTDSTLNHNYGSRVTAQDSGADGAVKTTNTGETSEEHDNHTYTNDFKDTAIKANRDITTYDTNVNDSGKSATKGHSGRTFAEMYREFAENVKNVDELIINELNPLFIMIYD